jgi:competence ComEA-like helix-hairpin-helix protein
VNINTASAEELDKIKWVGPSTATSIIDSRPFESLDDLLNVYGIGEIKLQDIKTEGIACVDGDENSEDNEDIEEDEKENETKEIISVNISAGDEKKEIEKETIELTPKDINTDSSELFKGKYALIGLLFFSVLITILLVVKFKTRDKNEFRGE